MWCLRFVTSMFCAATFSNSYVKWRLRYVMLHFVAVPFIENLPRSPSLFIPPCGGNPNWTCQLGVSYSVTCPQMRAVSRTNVFWKPSSPPLLIPPCLGTLTETVSWGSASVTCPQIRAVSRTKVYWKPSSPPLLIPPCRGNPNWNCQLGVS
jgi:hypothetical protein